MSAGKMRLDSCRACQTGKRVGVGSAHRPLFPQPPHSARSSHESGAFTLIELLVVIVIISILVAILVPVLRMVRSRMDSAQCLAQLGRIGVGMAAYINDHDGILPGPLSFEQSPTYLPSQSGSLAALLENYLSTASTTSADGRSQYSPLFECPAAARIFQDPTKPTYIVNMLQSPENGQCVWGDVTLNQKPLPKSALADWNNASIGSAPLTLSETWAIQDGDQNYVAQAPEACGTPSTDLLPTQAHVDHYNDLFFDFHAASRASLIVVTNPTGSTPVPTPSPAPGSQ